MTFRHATVRFESTDVIQVYVKVNSSSSSSVMMSIRGLAVDSTAHSFTGADAQTRADAYAETLRGLFWDVADLPDPEV